MTKKDYERIARVLWECRPPERVNGTVAAAQREQWRDVVNRFAGTLAETNPRFDRSRFVLACEGVDANECSAAPGHVGHCHDGVDYADSGRIWFNTGH